MKKKMIVAIAAVMVMGLAVAALAYSRANSSISTAISCCGDSCPMKKKDASGKETAAEHENCDCCKDGAESCPMMKKDASGTAMKMDGDHSCPMMAKDSKASAAAVKSEGSDSCPMKNGGHADKMAERMKHDMKADGTGHCCACCNHDKEKKDAPAV